METIVVKISDARVASDERAVLATYALGSCVAVAVYDAGAKVGGILHYQLPTSTLDPDRAQHKPAMFADTGMTHLLREMRMLGANPKRIKVKLAGGAQMFDDNGLFDIGRKNHAAIRKVLWQHGLLIDGQDIGGTSPRNLFLHIADGKVECKTGATTRTL